MRNWIVVLLALAWAAPSAAHYPAPGDPIVPAANECSLLHFDPITFESHVISHWDVHCGGIGGPVVGDGPGD